MNEVFRTAGDQFRQKLPQLTQNQEVRITYLRDTHVPPYKKNHRRRKASKQTNEQGTFIPLSTFL